MRLIGQKRQATDEEGFMLRVTSATVASLLVRHDCFLLRSRSSFCSSSSGEGGDRRLARRSRKSKATAAMENQSKQHQKENGEQQQQQQDDSLGQPPEKPLPGDCCGSGCERCVWDIYFDELEEYKQRKKELEEKSSKST